MLRRAPKTAEQVGLAVTVVVGIDLQSIDVVRDSLARFGDRYRRRLYSDRELEECETNPENMANGLAVRFAAKEAVLKVLRPNDHIPSWRTIEIQLSPRGGPKVVLTGEAESLARQRGVEKMSLSVSLGREYAIATVIADVTRNESEEHV